jgi:hypothetical protein
MASSGIFGNGTDGAGACPEGKEKTKDKRKKIKEKKKLRQKIKVEKGSPPWRGWGWVSNRVNQDKR